MRIAHLDTGRTWRGGQGQCLLLMRELRARGHEQCLLAPEGPLLARARSEGFTVHPWRPRTEVDVFAMFEASRVFRREGIEIVHAHSAHAHAVGVPAARLGAVAAVFVSRRVAFRIRRNPFSAFKYMMPVDRYLCISEGVRQAMLDSGVPAPRLRVVPSGVDFGEVRAAGDHRVANLREWLDLPADAEIVGTIASLTKEKNHAFLLEAVPAILRARPRARFVWVGEGEMRHELERRRAELGLVRIVHMPGFHEEPRAVLRQFDLFALPSRLEGLCVSVLDAQVLGIPVVATAVGGLPELIRDHVSGRLVDPLDPGLFAAAIVEALSHPDRRAEWVVRAASSVEAFRIENTAERTLEAYREVLREPAPMA